RRARGARWERSIPPIPSRTAGQGTLETPRSEDTGAPSPAYAVKTLQKEYCFLRNERALLGQSGVVEGSLVGGDDGAVHDLILVVGVVLALPVQRDNGHLRGQDFLGVEQVLLAHFHVGLGGSLGNQVVILLVAPEAVVVAAVGNPQVQEVDGVVVVGSPAAQGH